MIQLYVETTIGLLECVDVQLVGIGQNALSVKGIIPPQEQEYRSQYAAMIIDKFERRAQLPGALCPTNTVLHINYDLIIKD